MTYPRIASIMLMALLFAVGCDAPPKQTAITSDRPATDLDYERLKNLSGDWYLVSGVRLGVELEPDLEDPFLSYSVSSGGHSVIEKLFAGKPNEMTSVYYLDSGRLMMDHYCSLGNQPRMVAIAGSENTIPFQLITVSNLSDKNELHISSHSLTFDGPNELTATWGATEDEKPGGGSRYTVRRSPAP